MPIENSLVQSGTDIWTGSDTGITCSFIYYTAALGKPNEHLSGTRLSKTKIRSYSYVNYKHSSFRDTKKEEE